MDTLTAIYRRGSQRLRTPEETWHAIQPAAHACGITRCTEVTYLDTLGIPVFCAIRPRAAVLQVSNGKGLTRTEAQVSAVMEAIEFFHAEAPDYEQLRRASARTLRAEGIRLLRPDELVGFEPTRYYADDYEIEWTPGEDLDTGESVLVPSSAVFFHRVPDLHVTTTNGLASGNHLLEATLHALYELVERDAAARLLGQARIPIAERCRVIDLSAIEDPDLRSLVDAIARAGSTLVLLHVQSEIPIYTFWAVLLNEDSFISGSTFHTGWGTHLDVAIAASRAITEAAQSRATMIHGSREDAVAKPVFRDAVATRSSKAFQFFRELRGDVRWSELEALGVRASERLTDNLDQVTAALGAAGHRPLIRCDLSDPAIGVPVVKVLAPSLRLQIR
jgi:ribosomal protein S12 methylthiotransferase accessory factor